MSNNTCYCGGKAKKGIAFVNFHYVRKSFLKGEVEFETKLVQCNKCTVCGHSWAYPK